MNPERFENCKCEVCRAPATNFVRDIKQLEPEPGDNWMRFGYANDLIHMFCDRHARPSETQYVR